MMAKIFYLTNLRKLAIVREKYLISKKQINALLVAFEEVFFDLEGFDLRFRSRGRNYELIGLFAGGADH